jgi:hypothetical protein
MDVLLRSSRRLDSEIKAKTEMCRPYVSVHTRL